MKTNYKMNETNYEISIILSTSYAEVLNLNDLTLVYKGFLNDDFEHEAELLKHSGTMKQKMYKVLVSILNQKKELNSLEEYKKEILKSYPLSISLSLNSLEVKNLYLKFFPIDSELKQFQLITSDSINQIIKEEIRKLLLDGYYISSNLWVYEEHIRFDKEKMQLLDENDNVELFDTFHLSNFYDEEGEAIFRKSLKSLVRKKSSKSENYIKAITSGNGWTTYVMISSEHPPFEIQKNELEEYIDTGISIVFEDGKPIDINSYLGESTCVTARKRSHSF